MVELFKIGFAYASGKSVLADVSLRAGDGEFVVLLGANGAGKSTLLKIISGYLKPSRGCVLYGSEDISAMSAGALAARRSVLEQESALGFDYSVLETVMLGGFVRADSRRSLSEAAFDALESVGLAGFGGRVYTKLSGGEKRRVQLARALCQLGNPRGKVLLLDEPSAGLDPAHAHAAMAAARRAADGGATVFAVLHDPNLAAAYADKIALIKGGGLFAFGGVSEVLDAEKLSSVYEAPCEIVRGGSRSVVYFPPKK